MTGCANSHRIVALTQGGHAYMIVFKDDASGARLAYAKAIQWAISPDVPLNLQGIGAFYKAIFGRP